jgi:hypothetical protein
MLGNRHVNKQDTIHTSSTKHLTHDPSTDKRVEQVSDLIWLETPNTTNTIKLVACSVSTPRIPSWHPYNSLDKALYSNNLVPQP